MAANTFLTLDGINFGENIRGNPTAGTVSSYAFGEPRSRKPDSIHFVMEELGAAPQLINARNSAASIARGVLVATAEPTPRSSRINILTLTLLDSFVSSVVISSEQLAFTLNFSRVLWKGAFVPMPVDETMGFDDSLMINRLKSS